MDDKYTTGSFILPPNNDKRHILYYLGSIFPRHKPYFFWFNFLQHYPISKIAIAVGRSLPLHISPCTNRITPTYKDYYESA